MERSEISGTDPLDVYAAGVTEDAIVAKCAEAGTHSPEAEAWRRWYQELIARQNGGNYRNSFGAHRRHKIHDTMSRPDLLDRNAHDD